MSDLRLGSMVMEDSGDGPPVLMVHGLGGSSNSFEALMPALAGYRVLRPDLPGAGRSAPRPGQPRLDGLIGALHDALRTARVARAHVVGHSMGTLIAQHLAARAPQTVASLTLFGPILEPPAAARQAFADRAREVRANGMAGVADSIASASVAAASREDNPVVAAYVRETTMRQDPRGYAAHCEALAAAEVADTEAIRCPTLLVAGELDPVATPDMARELCKRIAGARLEIVPRVAHWIMLEAPRRSAELLRAHLDDVSIQ